MSARRWLPVILALAVAAVTAGCNQPGSGDPFASCPPGMHRVRDVTQPTARQWVCAR